MVTTSVQAKITKSVNTGVKTWLGETKFVFLCPRDGLSGTLTDLTQLHVPEIHQHRNDAHFPYELCSKAVCRNSYYLGARASSASGVNNTFTATKTRVILPARGRNASGTVHRYCCVLSLYMYYYVVHDRARTTVSLRPPLLRLYGCKAVSREW